MPRAARFAAARTRPQEPLIATARLSRRALTRAAAVAVCLVGVLATSASAAPPSASRVQLNPNNADSSLYGFATVGPATYFTEGSSPTKLWRSDSSGLTEVTGSFTDTFPRIASGSTLYFTASDSDHGQELWKIESGTSSLVIDLTAGTGRTEFSAMAVGPDGDLYFVASVNGSTYTLYKTDGTEAGTDVVNYSGGPVTNVQELTRVGSQMYMKFYDYTHGEELWTTDGTVAGTQRVKDINPTLVSGGAGHGSSPHSITDIGGTAFFVANPGSGWALWKSDGTEAGTTPIDTGTLTSEPTSLQAAGSVLYFNQADGSDSVLRRTDGGAAETVLDGDGTAVQSSEIEFAGTTTYFFREAPATGNELWKTGGIGSAATLVKDIAAGTADSGFGGFATVGSDVYFGADDGTHGSELWKSDGTSAGTTMVKDIAPGAPSSGPMPTAVRGTTLLFVAGDGEHGRELWTTDGTSAGTEFTEDLETGPVSDGIGAPAALGGSAYFAGNDGTVYPPDFGVEATALYRATGDASPETVTTAGGGRLLAPRTLVAAGSRLFLTAYGEDGGGRELWATDGTPGGTGLLKDIGPGTSSADISTIVPVGSRVFFAADDGGSGSELWVSDGTSSGTTLVADLRAGTDPSDPSRLTAVGDRLFFLAQNDSGTDELWTSDGTAAGTTRVLMSGAPVGSVDGLAAVGTRLVVIQGTKVLAVASDAPTTAAEITTLASQPTAIVAAGSTGYFAQGAALWKTDGTTAGTVLVKDGIDENGGSPAQLTAVRRNLYFTAADGNGDSELWKSDGTDAGTTTVPGPSGGGGADPYGLLAVRDRLYFVATAGSDERWMTTDGTTTELLGGADPVEFSPFFPHGGAVAGDRLFLVYHSAGPDGSSLWRVAGLPAEPDPDPEPENPTPPDPGPNPGTGGGDPNPGAGGTGGAPTTPTTPPATPVPVLKLSIGKFALDRRAGTATFTLSYPAAATVKVSGPGVKTSTVKLRGKRVTVKVRPTAKLMRTLKRKHKATVTLTISCQPTSGKRVTVKKKITLVRR